MGALLAYPALFTTTSRRPKVSTAAWTEFRAAAVSVTSRATARTWSP
jgi:hypothetical protein